jgi:hypothetical protein
MTDASQREYLTQHQTICPYCSAEEFDTLKFWEEIVAKFQKSLTYTEPQSDQKELLAGQIRLIKPEYGGWVDGLFYNPPYVMVLKIPSDLADGIQVAQIYHDITLAGPGDLILEEEQTGIFDLFVESWNTYTLKSEYLGPAIAGVSAEIVEAMMQMEESEEAAPQWAMLSMPMTEQDPRLYFRELEVEVGYMFASRIVAEILAEFEKLQLDYDSVDDLQKDIKDSAKIIQFSRSVTNLETALTSARFPDEEYAKAAADDDQESIKANLVVLWDGRVKSFRPTQGFVTSKMRTDSSYKISGAFPLIPDNAVNPRMICVYWSSATGALVPDDMHWEVDSGSFYAKIQTESQDDEVFEFALVYESDEGFKE